MCIMSLYICTHISHLIFLHMYSHHCLSHIYTYIIHHVSPISILIYYIMFLPYLHSYITSCLSHIYTHIYHIMSLPYLHSNITSYLSHICTHMYYIMSLLYLHSYIVSLLYLPAVHRTLSHDKSVYISIFI